MKHAFLSLALLGFLSGPGSAREPSFSTSIEVIPKAHGVRSCVEGMLYQAVETSLHALGYQDYPVLELGADYGEISELESFPHVLYDVHELGHGGFGTVYRVQNRWAGCRDENKVFVNSRS